MRYDGNHFYILDQTLLPQQEKWLPCGDVETLVHIIRRLAIRGAPAIGISAAILLGLLAERGHSREKLAHEAKQLLLARPTAVNLRNNLDLVHKAISADTYPASVISAAERLYLDDITLCNRIAQHGSNLIRHGERILTHCHTGGIATAGAGTALGIIAAAHRQEKNIFVWVDETRPLLQGGRLTAWECLRLNIPHTIICDNAAAMLMRKKEIDRVLVGSDRIATNGDFANKIGTYSLAVLAQYHGIPFYVAAPQTTVDPQCPSGDNIPIEVRDGAEVKGVSGSFGICRWAPEESTAYNPAFDITPAELVSGWILDSGVFTREDMYKKQWWQG